MSQNNGGCPIITGWLPEPDLGMRLIGVKK